MNDTVSEPAGIERDEHSAEFDRSGKYGVEVLLGTWVETRHRERHAIHDVVRSNRQCCEEVMYRLFIYLLQPYTIAYVITGIAIFSLWRGRQATRGRLVLLTIGFGLMLLLSLPFVSFLSLASLEGSFPPLKPSPGQADAIVVLSGSYELPNSVQQEAVLGSDTEQRCLHAADVYHRVKPIPIVVSGAGIDPTLAAPSSAELMRDMLVKLGVQAGDLRLEPSSRSTYENAVECRKLLYQLGIRRIFLVTEATHMRRAVLCFRQQGIEVVPAACHHRATDFDFSILNFLPTPTAADGISDAIHEWLGLAWYRLRGRL